MKKSDFIISLNSILIKMIRPEYRPDLKDMFSVSAIDYHFPEVEAAFLSLKKNKDIFEAVKENLKGIKECFVIHFQENIPNSKKINLLTKNSKVRLDSLDIEEILEELSDEDFRKVAKKIFEEY
jgi:hypothetical protein